MNQFKNKKISIVVPVHNEEGNIAILFEQLEQVFSNYSCEIEYLFVNDGSSDKSLDILMELNSTNSNFQYISFTRNFGHQLALKAGIDLASGDAIICMDCDLQHSPSLIPEFLNKWAEGYDVVYSKRIDNNSGKFKRTTSRWFYRMINFLSEIQLEFGTADFRLIDKRVAEALRNFKESDPFWRGLVPWTGYKKIGIDYEPQKRYLGETSYTFKRMVKFAIQGLTSLSVKPLYFAIYFGFIVSFLSILYVPYVLISYWRGDLVSGWASLIFTIAFFAGIQTILLGIIGIYVGKIFIESKNRPHYLIDKTSLK